MSKVKVSRYFTIPIKLLVILVCIWYLGRSVAKIDYTIFRLRLILPFFVFTLSYFLTTLLMSKNWHLILNMLDNTKRGFPDIASIYFRTAIAKYIPSNMLHYVGRHFLGKQINFSHHTIMSSNLLEALFAIVSAAIIVSLSLNTGILRLPVTLQGHRLKFEYLALICLVISTLLPFLYVRIKTKKSLLTSNLFVIKKFFYIIINYVLFFTSAGLIFFGVFFVLSLTETSLSSIIFYISIYTCSWVFGFITPGAPGGIGVRESIMVILLSDSIGAGHALTGSLLFRVITISGEFIGYFLAETKIFKDPVKAN